MRRALAVVAVFILSRTLSLSSGHVDPLSHPTIREVIQMVNGGVFGEVIVERVRRLEPPPVLDARSLARLREKGVPDTVLLELTRTLPADTCDLRGGPPGHGTDLRKVLQHPSIAEVLREVDAGVPSHTIVERVRGLRSVPVLDARALTKLTSEGVPDAVLLELVRARGVGSGASHAELLAEVVPRTEGPDPLLHPSIGEIVLMLQEGIGEDVILERIRHLPKVPALDACSVEKLGAWGVGDELVRELLQRRTALSAGEVHTAQPLTMLAKGEDTMLEAPKPTRKEAPGKQAPRSPDPAEPAVAREGVGRIRVVAQSSLPVTYLEVLVDGTPVSQRGEVQEGQTTAGWTLPRPPVVDVRKGLVVYDSVVPAGRHEVQASFALARIVETDWDPVLEAHGQRYETTSAGPEDESGGRPVCELQDGRTCTVHARLTKRRDGYAVTYAAKLR